MVLGVVHDGGSAGDDSFIYQDGSLIDSWDHVFATDVSDATLHNGNSRSRIVIGRELSDNGYATMDVACVRIYNTALDTTAREAVEAELRTKYLVNARAAAAWYYRQQQQ